MVLVLVFGTGNLDEFEYRLDFGCGGRWCNMCDADLMSVEKFLDIILPPNRILSSSIITIGAKKHKEIPRRRRGVRGWAWRQCRIMA